MTELLRCDSRAFGIPTVVQAIQSQRLSGRLVVSNDQELGTADFAEGHPVASHCGSATGRSGFLDLFTASATTLRVQSADVAPAPPLGTMLALVIEGCRLKDEWTRLAHCVRSPGERPLSEHPFVRQLKEGESMIAATQRLAVSRVEVIDLLRPLLDEGLLVVADATEEPRLPSMTFPELLDAGQRHHQRGDAARALEAFEAALRLRPDDFVALQNRGRILELNPGLAAGDEP